MLVNEGDEVTIRKLSNLIGKYMRLISHVEATIVVDTKEDIFYLIKSTGKSGNSNGVYRVLLVGHLDRLIKVLLNGLLKKGGL